MIAIILVAIGTYLTRFLPMYFNVRRLNIDEFLTHSSMALISALFITSFVTFPVKLENLSVSSIALAFVFVSYKKWKNLGVSILIGVFVHALLS